MTDKCRPRRASVGGHPVEDDARREAVIAQHFDAVADLHHDAAVRGEDRCPLARLGAGRGIDPHQRHGLSNGVLHQRARRQQVEIEILFDDANAAAAQRDGRRLDLRGDIGKFLAASSGRQVEHALVFNQRAIVVVDGDRDVALRRLLRRRNRGRAGQAPIRTPGTRQAQQPRQQMTHHQLPFD